MIEKQGDITGSIGTRVRLDDLQALTDVLEALTDQRRRDILHPLVGKTDMVGMVFTKGRRGTKTFVKAECNGQVVEIRDRMHVAVKIVAPIRYAGKTIEANIRLLTDPFDLQDEKETVLKKTAEPSWEQ